MQRFYKLPTGQSSLGKIKERPWEDGDELIGVRWEGITDTLPYAVETAQGTLSSTIPHCYPPVGSSSLNNRNSLSDQPNMFQKTWPDFGITFGN
jgi:hypothetical protein